MIENENDIEQGQELVDITELINPFPGLRPFGIEESHLFFGREGQSDEVLMKLSENRFVAILGASGSGKSSFMYCGLVPSLNGGFMTKAGSNWKVVVARPGGGPIDNLAAALLIKDKSFTNLSEEDRLIRKTILGTVLRSSSLGLVEVIKQLRSDDYQNVLVIVDQFEELFRFRKLEEATSDLDESSAFVNLLLEAVHQFDEPIYVALTMRSDFIGECAKFPDLTQMINDSHYLIPQMTRDQKRMAVEGPVAVGGGKLAPRLTQQLLNDVGDNPDQLPILQHALMRTWSFWTENRKPDEPMDLRHYNAVGTLKEALSQHANEAFDSLSKREKEICEVMFKALTERGNENQGIRRPTKMGTLAAIAGVSEDEVIRVVDKFREPGRSLLMPPHGIRLESETVIDISHESLMRIWDRLKRWLGEESKAAEMYIKLSEASERFQEGKASLWKMPDLQLALNWREENRPTLVWGQRYNPAFERTMVFLETSEKAYITEQRNKELLQKRQVRRIRLTAVVLGLAALVSLFFVVYANIKASEAEKNSILAAENALEAQRQAEIADEKAAEAISAEAAADNARLEAEQSLEDAVRARAQAEKQRLAAVAAEGRALAASEESKRLARFAQESANEANLARDAADSARDNANRLRFQSISQSMAIKAQKIPTANLKGVVGKQAYDFYHEFKDPGKDYQGDIYAGIYYGLRHLLHKDVTVDDPNFRGDSILNQYHGHPPIIDEYTGKEKQVSVRSLVFSHDGKTLYSTGSDGRLVAWDMTSEKRSYKEIYKSNFIIRVVKLSPDERYIVMGTDDKKLNSILLLDLNNLSEPPRQIPGHIGGTVYDLVFLPDGKQFISTGVDSRILLHDLDGTTVEIARTANRAKTLDVSPDGKLLAAGTDAGAEGEVLLIDLTSEDRSIRSIYRKDGGAVQTVHFSHKGNLLAFGDTKGTVFIWDLIEKHRWGPPLTGFSSPVTQVHFSPEDNLVAATSRDKTARVWDLTNIYDLPMVMEDHKDWVFALDFHPKGEYFMTGSADGIIRKFFVLPDTYAEQLCGLIEVNMTTNEWRQYVGEDIDYIYTCEGRPQPEEDE